jgi:VanZ family protein
MIVILRFFAWLLTAAVAFANLGPPRLRPHFHLGQNAEHALAFLLLGLAFGVAYPRHRLIMTGVAVILAGAIELLQFLAPGRHARLQDFIVDALAACIGIAVAAGVEWLVRRMQLTRLR